MGGVVVTGLGPVSSIGVGVRAFAAALRAGRSGIGRITSFDPAGFPYVNAGEVGDFSDRAPVRNLDPGRWGRSSLLAAGAGRLALADAGLAAPADAAGPDPGGARLDPDRAAVVIGTTSGESQVVEAVTARWVDAGPDAVDGAVFRQAPASRLAAAVSTELGFRGESITLATACSASNYALGYGHDLIATGEADVVVAGGADSVCRWAHAGFFRLGALTAEACSPFDRERSGILTGEGGAALVLESEAHARARGARVYAELRGYATNCDAHHMVAPDADTIADCMRMAHHSAGVEPGEVDYISAHGTGTPANDSVEVRAIHEVFGQSPPPVSSIKSMLGHTMGAASGFGAIASALALAEGFLPPTINWRTPDPELGGIDPVPNRARESTVRIVQNDGFAFGGNNAITVFGAPEQVGSGRRRSA